MAVKIIAIAGSTRTESLNKKLMRVAAKKIEEAGAEVVTVDLRDYPLPMYDGDLFARDGHTEVAKKLKQLFLDSQGILFASAEYNASFSAVLKNAIDWISRPYPGEASLAAFTGKVAALTSASPGALGGMRGLYSLREMLIALNMIVLPALVTVPGADKAFDAEGNFTDPKTTEKLAKLAKQLVTYSSCGSM